MTPFRITLHCSDTPNGKLVPIEEIRRWHVARGFKDIGYHFVIFPDGAVGNGRPITETGAHVLDDNKGNIGVCLEGRDRFTPAQFRSLRGLLDALCSKYGIVPSQIFGHYEFPSAREQGKTCPNMDMRCVRDWYVNHDDAQVEAYLFEG